MLMPECKAIMETLAKKRNPKTATKESRVISLHRAVDGTWKHRLFDEFLVRTGLATQADFIEALACESDSSCIADLKLWLDRLEPHWRNQPKMTFIEAQALWETDQRCPVQDWSIQTTRGTEAFGWAISRRRTPTAMRRLMVAVMRGGGGRGEGSTPRSVSRSSNSDPRSPASRCMCFAPGWWLMGLISGGRHSPWTPRARAVLD